jgi:hypothetical protein
MIVQSAWPTSTKEIFRTPGSLTEVAGVGLAIEIVDEVGTALEVEVDALFDVIGLLLEVTEPWQPKESTRIKTKIAANRYHDFFNLDAS